MNIQNFRQGIEKDIQQIKGTSALVEWLRDRLYSNTNRRWFLQPYTLLAIRKAHGKEALSIAQDYMDEPMARLNDIAILNKDERSALGPKMAQEAKFHKYICAFVYTNGVFHDELYYLEDAVESVRDQLKGLRVTMINPVGTHGYTIHTNPVDLQDSSEARREIEVTRGAGERLSITDIEWLDLLL